MIGLVAIQPASAQNDDDDSEEIVIETEDGHIIIIEEDSDGDRPHVERRYLRREAPARRLFNQFRERGDVQWHGHDDAAVTDTTIDGQRVIIIRMPDGDEQVIELDGIHGNDFAFHMQDFESAMEDFNMQHLEHDFDFEMPGAHEMRLRMFGGDGANAFAFGPNFMHLEGMMGASSETRREMMELERRSMELAARIRHDEEGERAELGRELDDVLESLFDLRGRARTERADHMEEQAEELRQEAQELRDALNERNRDRGNIIEERKRELLGERGNGW